VADKGLDWQWIVDSSSTDASCPGARRFAFVAGFAPAYQPCTYTEPLPEPGDALPEEAPEQAAQRGGWRNWFGIGGNRNDPAKQAPPPPPPPPPQPVPGQQ